MKKRKNIVVIHLDEPNLALAQHADFLKLATDPEEALMRYHAVAEVLLAQLVGLKDSHVRFVVTPADGIDAVRFWLLPMLRGEVQSLPGSSPVYLFTPEQRAPSLTVDFSVDQGDLSPFEFVAELNPFCLECGARLLNMAFLQCDAERNIVGDHYLYVSKNEPSQATKESLLFPRLPLLETDTCWDEALQSPLGGKLEKAYKKQC